MKCLKGHIFLKIIFLLIINIYGLSAQDVKDIQLGVYYFDGWTGKTNHISDKLLKDYTERMPIGGYKTSTQEAVDNQIIDASSYGVDFFNFCWYQRPKDVVGGDYKNNALGLYLKSKYKHLLNYSLLIVNHEGYFLRSDEWPELINHWTGLFADTSYVKVNDRPLITFFSVRSLIKTFGSTEKVKLALKDLEDSAIRKGMKGVTTAICLQPDSSSVRLAEKCGFDIITGYNFHTKGFYKSDHFSSESNLEYPISNMIEAERNTWDFLSSLTSLKQIPVVTLNWDKRPWTKTAVKTKRYVGFSKQSVSRSVESCREWLNENSQNAVTEKIAFVYAWNEYGEGAWLTPSLELKDSLLRGLSEGLKK